MVKEDGLLKIGFKPNRSYDIGEVTTEATATMPKLTGVTLSGIIRGTVTGFRSSQTLYVDVFGPSSLSGDIEAGDGRFSVSGTSQVTLTDSAEDVSVRALGSSEVDLTQLPVVEVDAHANGDSRVIVYASGRLDAEANGGSRVHYLGDPTLGRRHTFGSGSIQHK